MLQNLSTVPSYFALLALMLAPFYSSSQTTCGFSFSVMTKEGNIVKRDSSYGYEINAMVGDRICILNNERVDTSLSSPEGKFPLLALSAEQKGWIHISKGKKDMWIHFPWIPACYYGVIPDTIPFIPGSFGIGEDSIERFRSTTDDDYEKLRRLRFKLEEYPENTGSEILPRFWVKKGEINPLHTPTVFINDSVRDDHPYFKEIINHGAADFWGFTEALIAPLGPDGDQLSFEADDCSFNCYIYRSCFVEEGKEKGTYYISDEGERRRDTFPMVLEGEPMIHSKTTQAGYIVNLPLPRHYIRTTGELHFKTTCGGKVMEVSVPYWDSTFYDLDFSRRLLLDSIPFKPGKWKLNLQQLYPCDPDQRERGYCDIIPDDWEDSEAVRRIKGEQ